MMAMTDRNEFIRIANLAQHQRGDNRRDWTAIKKDLAASKRPAVKELAKRENDALSSRLTSYNGGTGKSRVITLNTVDALNIHKFASRVGVKVMPANLSEVRALMEMEVLGFRISANA